MPREPMTVEQQVAHARNSNNLMDAVVALKAIERTSMGARAFQELASPLIQQVVADLEPFLAALPEAKRRKGTLIDLAAHHPAPPVEPPPPPPRPRPPQPPPADLTPDDVRAMSFADLKALWGQMHRDKPFPKADNDRVTKDSLIAALLG